MLRRLFPLACPSCGAWCVAACPDCTPTFGRVGPSGDAPEGLDALWCSYTYDGAVRRLVLASKATPAHGWLPVMAAQLPRPGAPVQRSSAVVTWATGSTEHRRRRGYDPAERLARPYARLLGLPVLRLLDRVGGPQEGRTAEQRRSLRFVARRPVASPLVFVVDDVVTTGASMSAAAAALRQAGAERVIGVAFARREWSSTDE